MLLTAPDRVVVQGHVDPGFEKARDAFAANFTRRRELGGAVGACPLTRLARLRKRVATYWPQFAQHGKAKITVRQLLAHQAGLFALDEHLDRRLVADLDRLMAVVRLAWRWRLAGLCGPDRGRRVRLRDQQDGHDVDRRPARRSRDTPRRAERRENVLATCLRASPFCWPRRRTRSALRPARGARPDSASMAG
jgi:beta-lactamase family protein